MLALVVVAAGRAAAHPHIWIDGSIRLLVDDLGLHAVEVTWVFDDFNSADMISLFDENGDGRISASDSEGFRTKAFEHLNESGYFTLLSRGTERLAIAEARNFRAETRGGRLVYRFQLPIRIGWRDMDGLVISFFDHTYYTDFKIEPVHPSYAWAGRRAVLRPITTQLASLGWGTIPVPGLLIDFR
jgi:ABC-type uncharacterized transport system substrate-binding protein